MTPILEAINHGLSLRDYAVLTTLGVIPMSRQDIEEATGLGEMVVSRSTKKLVELKLISRDRNHVVGGNLSRAARYTLSSPVSSTPAHSPRVP